MHLLNLRIYACHMYIYMSISYTCSPLYICYIYYICVHTYIYIHEYTECVCMYVYL